MTPRIGERTRPVVLYRDSVGARRSASSNRKNFAAKTPGKGLCLSGRVQFHCLLFGLKELLLSDELVEQRKGKANVPMNSAVYYAFIDQPLSIRIKLISGHAQFFSNAQDSAVM